MPLLAPRALLLPKKHNQQMFMTTSTTGGSSSSTFTAFPRSYDRNMHYMRSNWAGKQDRGGPLRLTWPLQPPQFGSSGPESHCYISGKFPMIWAEGSSLCAACGCPCMKKQECSTQCFADRQCQSWSAAASRSFHDRRTGKLL